MTAPARVSRDLPPDERMLHVRVECPSVEAVRVRVAVSPLFTTVASLFEVFGGWRRGADDRWAGAMLERAGDLDLSQLEVFTSEARTITNCMLPLPERPDPTFAEELERIARTPPETVVEHIRHDFGEDIPEVYRSWLEDPSGRLLGYVAGLSAWWSAVIAPEWTKMVAILETEVLRVARTLATEGRGPALASVHPRLKWRDGELIWPTTQWIKPAAVGKRDILLLPMACGADGLITSTDREEALMLAYGAPGTGALFNLDRDEPADALAAMLGAGRSAVLRALDGATPVTAVGNLVGLARSTACEHLQSLADMELVQRSRVSRYVLYSRTERGQRLVELL